MRADGVVITVVVAPEMLVNTPVVVKVVAGVVAEFDAGAVAEVATTDRKDAASSRCWG